MFSKIYDLSRGLSCILPKLIVCMLHCTGESFESEFSDCFGFHDSSMSYVLLHKDRHLQALQLCSNEALTFTGALCKTKITRRGKRKKRRVRRGNVGFMCSVLCAHVLGSQKCVGLIEMRLNTCSGWQVCLFLFCHSHLNAQEIIKHHQRKLCCYSKYFKTLL